MSAEGALIQAMLFAFDRIERATTPPPVPGPEDPPHHPRCPANPDSPEYAETYVDVDRVRLPACRCPERDQDDYDREMERRVDRERDK